MDAVTIIPMPATREEWLALRSSGKRIGASEVAALFDASAQYGLTRYALWHVKAGLAPPPPVDGLRITWGLKLEAVIADAAAEVHGWKIQKGRYALCDDAPLAASLDFEILDHPDGPGVLETKNADWLAHKRSWQNDEPPMHILLQLQSQLACTGYKWGVVACLIGGNDLRTYRYDARPKLIAEMKTRAIAFWRSIADNKPPPIDGSDGASHVLKSLYPEVIDDAVDMRENNEWPEAVEEFIAASERNKEAKSAYDLAKNRVAELLGAHKRGWGAGYSVTVSVTSEKPDRPAALGDIIKGRAETRRYTAKAMENQ